MRDWKECQRFKRLIQQDIMYTKGITGLEYTVKDTKGYIVCSPLQDMIKGEEDEQINEV